MEPLSNNELVSLLVRHLASGALKSEDVLPVIEELVGPSNQPLSTSALLAALGDEDRPAWKRLREALHRKLLKDACAIHDRRRNSLPVAASSFPDLAHLPFDAPLGWRNDEPLADAARTLLELTRFRYFLAGRPEDLAVIRNVIEKKWVEAWTRFTSHPLRWDDLHPDDSAAKTDEARLLADAPRRFAGCAGDRAKQQQVLDAVLTCPGDEAAAVILSLCNEPWAQERASLVLMMRFGKLGYYEWRDWVRFLGSTQDLRSQRCQALAQIVEDDRDGLRLIQGLERDPSSAGDLEAQAIERARAMDPEDFVNRWHSSFGPGEINRLLGLAEPPPLPSARPVADGIGSYTRQKKPAEDVTFLTEETVGLPPVLEETIAVPPPLPVKPKEPEAPPPPPKPSVWHKHIQPFIAENWYMLAGLVMVLVGASLLAYFTWDRAWYWRYTVMPALLAVMTMVLARTGGWLEEKSSEARGAGMLLRAAAMGLLPVNFMAVALLSRDQDVGSRGVIVPIMSLIYLTLFGWQLRKWCAGVLPSLGWLLGGALLCLNALVATGPLAMGITENPEATRMVLVTGFYAGFFIMAASLIRFSQRVLTSEMAAEKLVPWFFGGTLALTYVQVFAWVHWTMGFAPAARHYAVLAILAGGLVLLMEWRFIELEPSVLHKGAESFLGFALVLMGVLMGMRQPELRIAVFALAGVVWLRQAGRREGLLHYWIGLTLLLLGGASIGLLEGFPKSKESNWLPWLGIALALAVGLLRAIAHRRGEDRLWKAAIDFQPVVLILTVVVGVLSQWKYRSAPLETAAVLIVTAVVFAVRAYHVQRLGWVHTTMMLLALSLPYLGCVDMDGRSLHGNTMVFGLGALSALWLLLVRIRSSPLLVQARSTVLWTIGAFSVAAMLVRVALEQGTPGDEMWYRAAMDVAGPFLMAGVLLCTAYHSRSLVPSAMAGVILVILFPELKARFQEHFPAISWGTGFGSSCSALALALSVFGIRRWPLLQKMGEGDLFLGTHPFPIRRYDPSLFVIPVLCAAFVMVLRVDVWTLSQRYLENTVGLKTAVALGITGIAWIVLAIHLREGVAARMAVHASWIVFFLSFHFLNLRLVPEPQWQMPVLCTGLLLQGLFWIYRPQVARFAWVEGLLVQPTRFVLRYGSLAFAWVCVLGLLSGGDWTRVQYLGLFLVLQLAWHGLSSGRKRHGITLFFLSLFFLLAWSAPGERPLFDRLSFELTFTPVVALVAVIEVIQLFLEAAPDLYKRLRPLQMPFQLGGVCLTVIAACGGFFEMLGAHHIALTSFQQMLLVATLLMAARANRSGALFLSCVVLGYLFLQTQALSERADPEMRILFLIIPWRSAVLGLVMAALVVVGLKIHACCPKLLEGRYVTIQPPLPPRFWLLLPAAALALQAGVYQTADPDWRMLTEQLWAPYLGALTLAIVGFTWPQGFFFILAAASLTTANVHAVHITIGKSLDAMGLSNIHMVCIGFIFTLVQGTLARLVIRREGFSRAVNQWSIFMAGLVLILLAFNYFVHPNLTTITQGRFMISGLLAGAAGLYFWWAARHPGPGEEAFGDWLVGFSHFGAAMFLWCFALMVPALRHPNTVFIALGLPAVYFYVRAEIESGRAEGNARRYLNSATVMGFLLLIFYVSRSVFQMVLFPGMEIDTNHYHVNAPVVMALAFLLIRLRGLGGTWWLAFYGGISLIVGTYFSVTWYPGLSPFGHAIPAAWVALGLAHIFIVASYQRSPLRSFIQQIGAIDGEDWITLRRYWGRCLLAASQVMVLIALTHWEKGENSYQVAPLLAGAATVWIHQAIIGRISWYWIVAVAELAIALHADFFVASYIAKDDVVWVVLGIWGCMVFSHPLWKRWIAATQIAVPSVLLFVTGVGHVLYHHPASNVGLWAVALMAVLGLLTPQESRMAETGAARFFSGLTLLAAPWLVYFSQARDGEKFIPDMFATWPVLATAATVFATGTLARLHEKNTFPFLKELMTAQPRLYHQTLAMCETQGCRLNFGVLWLTFAAMSLMMVTHYGEAYATREMALSSMMWAGLAVAWFYDGRERHSMLSQVLAQLSVLGCFAIIRRQLMLTYENWNYEYDVWISLAVSCCIAGAKQRLARHSREIRVPMMGTLFAMPVVAMIWTVIHQLGTDITLVIVGLHSLMFAFLGRDDRESPYSMVAICGFMLFVIILFWDRWNLRFFHAIVIPVGIGILALLHVAGGRLERETKQWIRWVTLCAMLGSAGYYALIDSTHPIGFNLTMMLLCLAAMAIGSFFKVRLYLFLGFGALIVDLFSIVYKVMRHMENIRMTAIGLLILLLGAGLVIGSVYFKAHREEIEAWLERVRARFGTWE